MDLVIILIIVLYFGSVLGIYVRASRYAELNNVRYGSFSIPIITPILIIYCAIKEKDASYFRLFGIMDILAYRLLKSMSTFKKKTKKRVNIERYELLGTVEDVKALVATAH